MVEQEQTPLEGDFTSVSSRTSTNEESPPSPSPESVDEPERETDRKTGKFPARNVPDGQTCARTGLPYMAYKKPEVASVNTKETGERLLRDKKHEVSISRDYY